MHYLFYSVWGAPSTNHGDLAFGDGFANVLRGDTMGTKGKNAKKPKQVKDKKVPETESKPK